MSSQTLSRFSPARTRWAGFFAVPGHKSQRQKILLYPPPADAARPRAGFFDPGFGHPEGGSQGARAVLEVRSYEVPFVIEDGQTVGRLTYERLTARPARLYGQGLKSNYQSQGIALSKHFKLG